MIKLITSSTREESCVREIRKIRVFRICQKVIHATGKIHKEENDFEDYGKDGFHGFPGNMNV